MANCGMLSTRAREYSEIVIRGSPLTEKTLDDDPMMSLVVVSIIFILITFIMI